ncbi:MAG: fructose-1,6-bisphosphatase [Prevotella sp.]|nr:fructose-1,6-bisphosphatase [Prevotella sp.]
MSTKHYDFEKDKRYLELLSHSFPTVADASTEIINLQAILNLPKGTEHFLADIHGEHEAFQHILKNASGNIKRKVNDLFGSTLRESEKRDLCTLIYYPEQKLELIKQSEEDINDWYHITIHRLVSVCREVSSKYTRSKVHKALPDEFSYIIQELLHERTDDIDKTEYVSAIIDTIISTGRADDFICAISIVIQRLIIDRLHLLGDIYDRGPGAHIIMDTLIPYHRWDIQWGNHDILWMGASAGNDACICNVLRIALRYANMKTIEDGYGINLVPLATFAMDIYSNDPCEEFLPKVLGEDVLSDKAKLIYARMHKAISVIQFKLEAQLFSRHSLWNMKSRKVLEAVNYEKGVFIQNDKEYKMSSCNFPTVNPDAPNELTEEEKDLMAGLHNSFIISEKLHRHIRKILQHGCMYAIFNNNLLFHASIPLNENGTLKDVEIMPGRKYKGKNLMHNIGMLIRTAFQNDSDPKEKAYAIDYFLYLWCGQDSPLFDKSKMATFERYFIHEEETHTEEKGNYFKLRNDEQIIDMILDAFEVHGPNRHIINGHVPVHVVKGESPIRANGKLMVIDGGFSEPYHKETGIAGYTLVYHSRGFELVQHEPFTSTVDAIKQGTDIKSTTQIIEMSQRRMRVADTDKGADIRRQINDLEELLYAYRHGIITENERKK